MATLEDLLANSNPDQLQALRASVAPATPAPQPMNLNDPAQLQALIAAAKPQAPPVSVAPITDDSEDDNSDTSSGEDKDVVPVKIKDESEKDDSDETDADDSDKESEVDKIKRLLSAVKQTDADNKDEPPKAKVTINGESAVTSPKDEDSEDDDSEDKDSKGPMPASTSPVPLTQTQGTASPPVDPRMALLQAQMGFTNNSVAGLQAAQQRQADDRRTANLLQASATLGGAAAGFANHAAGPVLDTKPYDEMRKNADNQVKNYTDLTEQEKNDPNSAYSKSFQQFVKPLLTKLNMEPTMFDTASANQINSTFPMLTKMFDTATAQDTNRLKQKELAQDRDAKNDLKQQMIDLQADKNDTQKGSKGSNDQNKALQQATQLLESARGNPAAAQAEKDLYAASKAKSLSNLYGDPDKLSPQMAQLLYSEVAKIAAGNAPTEAELQGLNPGALQGKLAGPWQKLSNEPTPANAGAFIKQYQDYADALGKDAQKVLEDKYTRIIEPRKDQLGDVNYKALQDQYTNRFKGPISPLSPTGYPKTVINKATGQQATVSNDNDYKDAQAHGFQ